MSTLRAFLWALLIGVCLTGCGGAGRWHDDQPPTDVAATPNTPNYRHELGEIHVWLNPIVTYRFTRPEQATSIHNEPLRAEPMSERQKEDTRRAFGLWQAELASNPPEGRREFVEVGQDEPADIEVIVRRREDFERNLLGKCTVWRQNGIVARRAVIQIRADLGNFAHVGLHEAGHAVYSTDHSSHGGDVMFATATRRRTPSERDGNTARAIYHTNYHTNQAYKVH